MDIEKLEKLTQLKKKGIITQEEFEVQKARLLNNHSDNVDDLTCWYYFKMCMTKKYCTFDGRARRKEFFGCFLWQIIICLFVVLFAELSGGETLVSISGFLIFIIFLLPTIGLSVRRLHDVGRSGFWASPYYLEPFLQLCSEMGIQVNNIIRALMLASLPYLIFIFFKSDEQENQYGPVPEGVFD